VNILATSSWAMFQAGRVFEAGLRFKKAAAIWSRGVLTEQKNGSKHTETDIDGLLLESEIMLADAEAGLLLNDAGSTHDTWKISELQAKADVEHHRAANLRSILAARTPGLEPSNFHSTAPLPPPHGFRFAVVLLNELERNAWLRTLNTKRRLNERDFGEQLGDRGVLKLLNTLTSQMSSIVDDSIYFADESDSIQLSCVRTYSSLAMAMRMQHRLSKKSIEPFSISGVRSLKLDSLRDFLRVLGLRLLGGIQTPSRLPRLTWMKHFTSRYEGRCP
jgi:hypothetical protein